MPASLRVLDTTNHGGMVTGPGVSTVLIGGMPASVMLDGHLCAIPVTAGHPVGVFAPGSATVLIGGMPALRITDSCTCGAMGLIGEPTVEIGG